MLAMDKNEKIIIYSCEKNKKKGPKKIIWLFFIP